MEWSCSLHFYYLARCRSYRERVDPGRSIDYLPTIVQKLLRERPGHHDSDEEEEEETMKELRRDWEDEIEDHGEVACLTRFYEKAQSP